MTCGLPLLAFEILAPAGLWIALAALPIIAFFLLRRRLQQRVIGSTMLWTRALKETAARAAWRRPTEWLALFLLLLAVAALALGAADARFGLDASGSRAFVLVLDTSASMATAHEGGTRLGEAQRGAREAIESMRAGDQAAVIAAGRRPRVLSHASGDSAALAESLRGLEADATGGDLRAACELAVREVERLSQQTKLPAHVLVFSDFAADPALWEGFDALGARIDFVSCGAARANAGIIHLAYSADAEPPGILVTVAANAVAAQKRTLSLLRDGEVVDARPVEIPPDGRRSVLVSAPGAAERGTAKWTVELEPHDDLALDDRAHLGTAPRPAPSLLVVGGEDPFLARLADVFPGLEVTHVKAADIALAQDRTRGFDLAIYLETPAGAAPVLAAHELYVGCLPEALGFVAHGRLVDPPLLDWQRSEPILRGIGFEDLQVVAAARLGLPEGARELVRVSGGAQLAHLATESRSVLVWASAMGDSNLPLIVAFPLLVRNLLGASLSGVAADARSAAAALRVPAGLGELQGTVELTAKAPSGKIERATLWAREDFHWPGRLEPGFYELTAVAKAAGPKLSAARFVGVSLLDAHESATAGRPPDPKSFTSAAVTLSDISTWRPLRPIWKWLAAVAIAALLIEAWLWMRR
jgi:Ca-activated chloride channel homolog